MCGGGGGYSPPPPPPPSPYEKTLRQQRIEARQNELAEKAKLKDEQYQESVAALSGKRGRRSLLSVGKEDKGLWLQVICKLRILSEYKWL